MKKEELDLAIKLVLRKIYSLYVTCATEICLKNYHALNGGGSEGGAAMAMILGNMIFIVRAIEDCHHI